MGVILILFLALNLFSGEYFSWCCCWTTFVQAFISSKVRVNRRSQTHNFIVARVIGPEERIWAFTFSDTCLKVIQAQDES